MFGSSIFRNDPFFNQNTEVMSEFNRMEQRMDQMLQNFGMPMMQPSIMAPPGGPGGMPPHHPHHSNHRQHRSHHQRHHQQHQHQQHLQQHQQQHQQHMMPFAGAPSGSMFESMFGNMNAMMQQMQNNPNTHSFQSSSSRVVSFSSDGSGAPKIYEASSSTTQGPGGVRQTRKSERNSETGVDRMAIGHHIYDRGHVVERSRNRRTNDQEENQEFLNMDEEEKAAFHEEWQRKARPHHSSGAGRDIGYNEQHSRPQNRRPQQRAINSAEYHRQNMEADRERPRERHTDGRGDQQQRGGGGERNPRDAGRRVQINSRAEEI